MRWLAILLLSLSLLGASPASTQQAREGEVADFILIDKSERTLWVYQGANVIRTYRGLQFGDRPIGHKQFEGDERTPEGRYTITYGNQRSSYFLSLHRLP